MTTKLKVNRMKLSYILASEYSKSEAGEYIIKEIPEGSGYKTGGYPVEFNYIIRGDMLMLLVDEVIMEAIDGDLEFSHVVLWDSISRSTVRHYDFHKIPCTMHPGETFTLTKH
jgi:hypothetical protein